MGWFSRRIKDPVRGTAYVASATRAPSGTSSASCRMHLALSIPGETSVAIEKTAMVATKHWPYAGMSLPIEAERGNPNRFRILWDEMPTGRERGQDAAEQAAAAFNEQGHVAPPAPSHTRTGPRVVSSSVTINGQTATPEEIAHYEGLVGMDLNGDGVIGAGDQPAVPSPTDRVSALERLAALRDSGALTPEEFEAEKERILGS